MEHQAKDAEDPQKGELGSFVGQAGHIQCLHKDSTEGVGEVAQLTLVPSHGLVELEGTSHATLSEILSHSA